MSGWELDTDDLSAWLLLEQVAEQERLERAIAEQARLEARVDRDVKGALDKTFPPGWGLLSETERRAVMRDAAAEPALQFAERALPIAEPALHIAEPSAESSAYRGLAMAGVAVAGLGLGAFLWSRQG